MSLTLGSVTIDSTDPAPLARWWAEQLEGEIVADNDGWFYIVAVPGTGVAVSVQKVDDPTPGKNRIHVDFRADDPDAEKTRLIAAGATHIAEHRFGDIYWNVLADPQGNQFCVSTPEA